MSTGADETRPKIYAMTKLAIRRKSKADTEFASTKLIASH